jgi:hypothetical protein
LVAERIVVTLGRLSPSGVRYTRLRVTGSLICLQFLYWIRSMNGGGVKVVVILYILQDLNQVVKPEQLIVGEQQMLLFDPLGLD